MWGGLKALEVDALQYLKITGVMLFKMANSSVFAKFFRQVEAAFKAGNATEHTHRPALKTLVESLREKTIATNEPQRIACGAPDFIVTRRDIPLGYIEAKDIGVDLDRAADGEQLKRYRNSLNNLILTDYFEFRLFRNGECIQNVRLATPKKNGTVTYHLEAEQPLDLLFQAFFDSKAPSVSDPRELAERMARLAKLIDELIRQAFKREAVTGDLHAQYEAFKKILIADLSVDQFADMYAQTIAYGLFAARFNYDGPNFRREMAGKQLPKTNPFLRRLFNTIAGNDLDERIAWAVDDLSELLARANMKEILADFGKQTRQEDPVVHFYETFLTAYDPKLRELRGVYYTPEPVVDYIARSVDKILKTEFKLKDGLADATKIKLRKPRQKGKEDGSYETHRVQILDPACGTGTFLHSVVGLIHDRFSKNKGMWASYVAEHLLPRLHGFELLMAPYAVAHMKLGLQLKETGYDFAADERLRVYLTNTLEEAHELSGLPLFTQWLAEEAAAAGIVKKNVPIMVVLGNPPYSGHSANKGKWILKLLEDYKKSPELKKPAQAKWLSDDYVKFIRFAQWRIEQTGHGVLAFITSHSYLDNPTFLDMRASLMASFDEIRILDLHGNSKKKEKAPSGEKDENVFDIQQGVSIAFLTRHSTRTSKCSVKRADIWGTRLDKYEWLSENDVQSTKWDDITPEATPWLFIKQDAGVLAEYERGWSVADIFSPNGAPAPGFATQHDDFAISWTKEEAVEKVDRLLASATEAEARESFSLCAQSQWSYKRAKVELPKLNIEELAVKVLYRPFDTRFSIYDRNVLVHRRERVNSHMLKKNLALCIPKNQEAIGSELLDGVFCSNRPVELNLYRRGGAFVLPLWLYEEDDLLRKARDGKRPNLNSDFVTELTAKLGTRTASSPEDIFAYIYAMLYSNRYRVRYKQFLKRGFPRITLPNSASSFAKLAALGHELIELHLLKTVAPAVTSFPKKGSNLVEKIDFEIDPKSPSRGSVYINSEQYFDGVPVSVWNYTIGGYQVAHKWLKDRRGKSLNFEELKTYGNIMAALTRTLSLQHEIDSVWK